MPAGCGPRHWQLRCGAPGAGWAPLLIDTSLPMRRVAEGKALPAVPGAAETLAFSDATFDAVTMISMLHQVGSWRQALAEACRVLRPHGCLAVMLLTADHIKEVTWAYDLFPAMREFSLRTCHRWPNSGRSCPVRAGSRSGSMTCPMSQ